MPHNGDRHEYNRGIKLELTELDAEWIKWLDQEALPIVLSKGWPNLEERFYFPTQVKSSYLIQRGWTQINRSIYFRFWSINRLANQPTLFLQRRPRSAKLPR
jgi:hypothetical protein